MGIIGGGVIVALVLAALFASKLTPFNPVDANLEMRLRPPFWYPQAAPGHWLGTDQLGRDLLTRILFGARVSLTVAATAVTISGTLGVALGLLAGFYGGIPDHIIMRMVDVQLAFPFILLAIFILSILRPSLLNVIGLLALSSWVANCRLVRAQTLALREREFVMAARAMGCHDSRLLLRHVAPNLIAAVVIVAALQVAQVIITESVLSFLGLGVQPPTPTWGLTIGEGREYINVAWWIITFPGLALMLTVVSIGFLADWLRDRLDPTLRAS
jgi:peptide/nickel transport system permease protein